MAQSAQERTEKATPKKLREARKRGQVAQSNQVASAAVIAGIALSAELLVGRGWTTLQTSWDACFRAAGAAAASSNAADPLEVFGRIAVAGAVVALPFGVVAMVMAGLATFLQVGPVLTTEPLIPKLEKLNPIEGLKTRILSARGLAELGRATLAVIAGIAVAWLVIRTELRQVLQLGWGSVTDVVQLIGILALRCVWALAAVHVVIGGLDFAFQRWQFGRDQRMSKQDVKDEYRRDQGDPQLVAERKAEAKKLADQHPVARTKEGHLGFRNPTHLMCVVRYDPEQDPAPRLVARGQDAIALEMIDVARDHAIPVVHDIAIARALFQLDHDELVPPELYTAMAVVLRWVAKEAAERGESVPWEAMIDADADGAAEQEERRRRVRRRPNPRQMR